MFTRKQRKKEDKMRQNIIKYGEYKSFMITLEFKQIIELNQQVFNII